MTILRRGQGVWDRIHEKAKEQAALGESAPSTPTAQSALREAEDQRSAAQIAPPDTTAPPSPVTQVGQRAAQIDSVLAEAQGFEEEEESFLERAYRGFSRGLEKADIDQDAFLASMGAVPWEEIEKRYEEFEKRVAEDPVEGRNFLEEIAIGAAGLSGPMIKGSAQGGAAAATAALFGVAGPQALAPEEVITLPLAYAIGAGQYWYRVGTGEMYASMRRRGIDHDIAAPLAQGLGVPYALIEGIQVGRILRFGGQVAEKGVRRLLNRSLKRGMDRALARVPMAKVVAEKAARITDRPEHPTALRAVGEGAVIGGVETGKETLEETGQEIIGIGAETMGAELQNTLMDDQVAPLLRPEIEQRLGQVLSPETIGSMALLLAPGRAINTAGRIQASRQAREQIGQLPKHRQQQLGIDLENPSPEVGRLFQEIEAAGVEAEAETQELLARGIARVAEATGRTPEEVAAQLKIERGEEARAEEEVEGAETLFQLPQELHGVPASDLGIPEEAMAEWKRAAPPMSAIPKTAERALEKLDDFRQTEEAQNILRSAEDWHRGIARLSGGQYTTLEPSRAIEIVNNPSAIPGQLGKLNARQITMAMEGLRFGDQVREAYRRGDIEEKQTAKFFLWSILSRGQPAYPHESGAMLGVLNNVDAWIDEAIAQEGNVGILGSDLTPEQMEEMGLKPPLKKGEKAKKGDSHVKGNKRYWPEFREWVNETLGGTPGASGISNMNSFGEEFLQKMTTTLQDGKYAGREPMAVLHELIASDMTGPEVRREFHHIADRVGLDNKIVAFTLLVTGRKDLMVLDRVQVQDLWDGKRLKAEGKVQTDNIYAGLGPNANRGLADHMMSIQGLTMYELLEDGLAPAIQEGMAQVEASGRIPALREDERMGAYHWLSWVGESGQEVGHGSIEGIEAVARGVPIEQAFDGVGVQHGRFEEISLGTVYFYEDGQLKFGQEKSNGDWVVLDADQQRLYFEEMQAHQKSKAQNLNETSKRKALRVPDFETGRMVPRGLRLKDREVDWFPEMTDAHHENRDALLDHLGRQPTANEAGVLGGFTRIGRGTREAGRREREGVGAAPGGVAEESRAARESLYQEGELGTQGRIDFIAGQPAVIRLFESADETTLIHELGHWFRRMLPEGQQRSMDRWVGARPGATWTRAQEERFAEAWTDMLFNEERRLAFSNLRTPFLEWVSDLWDVIRGRAIQSSRRVRRAMEDLVGGPETLAKLQTRVRVATDRPPAGRPSQRPKRPSWGIGSSFLRAEAVSPDKLQGIELPPETKWQLFQRKIQDALNRVAQLQEHPDLAPDSPNLRRATDLYVGRAGNRLDQMEQDLIWNPKGTAFLQRMVKSGITIHDFGEFLYARHAIERNKHIREEVDPDNDAGSGMTDQEARLVTRNYPKDHPIRGFEKEFRRRVTGQTLKIQRDAGLISQETFDHLKGFYNNYVPLKGRASGKKAFPTLGRGFEVRGPEIRRAGGRASLADNPFVQSIVDQQQAIVRAEKNEVGQDFLDLVQKNPSPMWAAHKQRWMPRFDSDGNIEYLEPKIERSQDTMAVMVDGKTTYIEIKDEVLARALLNLGAGRGVPLFTGFHNYLRTMVTTLTPEFLLNNFQRDIQTALIHLSADQSFKVAAKVAKDTPAAIRGIHRSARGHSGAWEDLYQEMKAEGGRIGWVRVKTVEEQSLALEKAAERFTHQKPITGLIRWGMDQAERANEAVEMGVRLAAYKEAKAQGASKADAASMARELTVNFNRRGESRWLNSLYLFFNASIQGTANIFRHMGVPGRPKNKANVVTQSIAAGLMAAGYLQSWMNRLVDEDDWDDVNDFNKDTNWMTAVPIADKVFYIANKAPYGYNIFLAGGRVAEEIVNGDLSVPDGMKRMVGAAADAFSPLATGSFVQMFFPTALQPIVQWIENKNFFGGPIRKEQPAFAPEIPDSQLYFDSVRTWSKEFTTQLNEWFGGTERISSTPMTDINPEMLDHFIDAYGGGLGRMVANGIVTGESLLLKAELPDIRNTPILRALVKKPSESTPTRIAYNALRDSRKKPFPENQRERFEDAVRRAVDREAIERDRGLDMIKQFRENQREVEADLARRR